MALPDASLVRGLAVNDFFAHGKKGPAKIVSVSTDRSPRQILFVVETGKQVPPDARKVQAEMLTEIFKNARIEDSFALLTTRGPKREIRFGASKETLSSAVSEIRIGVTGKQEDSGVLDTVLDGIDWFQEHKEGDAVFVLAMGIESSHRASFSKVRDSLVSSDVHLFGVQLGPFIGGFYQMGMAISFGQTFPTAWIDPNLENMFALSRYTGGFAAIENTEGDPQKQYHLTDERLHQIRYVARQQYKAITEFYKIQIQGYSKDLQIDLSEKVRKQLPQAQVSYPRNLQNCSEIPSHRHQ